MNWKSGRGLRNPSLALVGSQEWAGNKKQRRAGGNLMGAANGDRRLPLTGLPDTVPRNRTFAIISRVPGPPVSSRRSRAPEGKVQMQNDSTTENANDAEVPRTGAAPDLKHPVGASETTELTAAGPIAGAGVDEYSTGLRVVEYTATSCAPPPAVASTNSVPGRPQGGGAKRALKVKCIEEPVRTSKNDMTSWKPPFEVEQGFVGSLKEIIKRADSVRAPLQATPVPTGSARYGTTDELFGRLQRVIAGQASVPEQTSILLTFWTICTWFADGLPIALGLAIVGPEFEGDLALRTLRNFCRYPQMLAGADVTSLQRVDWRSTPTLLFYAPNITKQMAMVLGCATSRGYMVGGAGEFKDFFGPKAIYIGQEVSTDRIPRCSLQVRLPANLSRARNTTFGTGD